MARLQRKWPGKFYSCLSGFIEPGESFEDAVKRELWEEAGVKVWDVRYHSSQPWVRHSYTSDARAGLAGTPALWRRRLAPSRLGSSVRRACAASAEPQLTADR